jgi:hypothetical protein
MMLSLLFACTSTSEQKKNIPSVSSPVEPQELCDFEQKKGDCIEKNIRVIGTIPKMVYSHPIISSPSGIDSIQSYLDLEDQQLIILSENSWECSGKVEVIGVLQEIDMGGPEGTRNSYRNYYISQSTIRCF